MRLDINTLESEFSTEEWRMIKDYLKWVKKEMKYPQKPEIHIGGARYPIGRFIIRRGLIAPFRVKIENKINKQPILEPQLKPIDQALSTVQTIVEELKVRGKSVKSTKRKKLNEQETK